ncbi:MAG: hypothetical protein WC389_22530 [Lutibacter sp.]|jgi:hypothetical protein
MKNSLREKNCDSLREKIAAEFAKFQDDYRNFIQERSEMNYYERFIQKKTVADFCYELQNKYADEILKLFTAEGYGKMILCPLFGNDCADKNKCEEKYDCDYDNLPCDENGVMFEPIKVEVKNGK